MSWPSFNNCRITKLMFYCRLAIEYIKILIQIFKFTAIKYIRLQKYERKEIDLHVFVNFSFNSFSPFCNSFKCHTYSTSCLISKYLFYSSSSTTVSNYQVTNWPLQLLVNNFTQIFVSFLCKVFNLFFKSTF